MILLKAWWRLLCSPAKHYEIICWNVRGLGNPRTFRDVKSILYQRKPDIIFLSEIRCNHSKIVHLMNALNYKDGFSVSQQGSGGGICDMWNDNVLLSITSSSLYHIDVNIQ